MNRPNDLELMAYFDGELEEPRRAEVARWLEDPAMAEDARSARQKLAGLALGAEIVRSAEPRADEPDPSAVEAILAAVAAEAGPVPVRAASNAVANDNHRWGVGLLGLAVAAAAAVLLWPSAPNTTPGVASAVSTGTTLAAVSVAAPPSASTGANEALAETDEEVQAVQVATVDFGTRTGAIYNVVSDVLQDGGSGAEKHVATTVVWIADP